MKKNEVKVGGLYRARISGRFVTLRVDRITEQTSWNGKACTTYAVTNMDTGRSITVRSAAKFRYEVRAQPVTPPPTAQTEAQTEGEQCPDPTLETSPAITSTPTPADTASTPAAMIETAPSVLEQEQQSCPTTNASFARMFARQAQAAVTPTTEPARVTAGGAVLTDQQLHILTLAREIEQARGNGQRVLRVKAGAGTGKTFELVQLEAQLSGNGQYTAYNAPLVADSKPKFRKAACNTTHSLAFRAVGRQYAHRLNGPRVRSHEIAHRLGITDQYIPGAPYPKDSAEWRECYEAAGYSEENPAPEDFAPAPSKRLKAGYLAGQVLAAITRFCQSADLELTVRAFRPILGIDDVAEGCRERPNSDRVRAYLLPFAQKAWEDISNPNGEMMPFAHDHYVKLWQMGTGHNRPVIAADYILLDEAQDTAPVFLSILQQQTHALLVLVGDDNQQIYEWRGAVNAMAAFDGAPTGMLSQSFRFGQVIADVANAVLRTLDEPTELVMRGLPPESTDSLKGMPSRVCAVASPRCYLYRTNAGAIGRLMAGRAEGKRGHLIGKADDVVRFCNAALDLQAKPARSTDHPELGCFGNWAEVQEYSKSDEGADLRLLVKLIDTFGAEEIREALGDMPKEEDADFVLCTAHKSKGREWSSVKLGADFPLANRMTDADRRLLYVAATRAQEELDITECPPFCGGWDKRGGGEDGSAEAEWIPGIEVTYSIPMPTAEQLAAYRAGMVTAAASTIRETIAPVATATQPAPTTTPQSNVAQGNGNTWARLRDGSWGIRGAAGQTGSVQVTRKDGSKSRVTIKRCVWDDGRSALYEVN